MKSEDVRALLKGASPALFSAAVVLGMLCVTFDPILASEPPAEHSSGPAARRVVESFHAALIDCMKSSDELAFAGRVQRIAENQEETFDIPTIARASVFRGWKRLSAEDRIEWIALARQYWASSYARECRSFSEQNFETLGVEPAANEDVVVHTRLSRRNDDDVELDYRLREIDGAWRIVDFHVVGQPSEVRRLREFHYAVLERRSFEELVAEINQKIEQFERESDARAEL